MLSTDLLKILVCPDSKAPLLLTKDGKLVSTDAKTRRLYRVEDGIPICLIDESEVLSPEDHARIVEEAKGLKANREARKV
ncbi:MAG: hypothetical protein PWP23_742 [Candidatus Sumerlaeota bacterium]|nr:hypothetical protein [Candidatus Sumerlaeota bacterium]